MQKKGFVWKTIICQNENGGSEVRFDFRGFLGNYTLTSWRAGLSMHVGLL